MVDTSRDLQESIQNPLNGLKYFYKMILWPHKSPSSHPSIHQPAVLSILLGLGGGMLPGLSLSLLALLSMGPAPRFCIFLNPVHASETNSNAAHPSATYTSPLGTASNP